MEAGSRDVLMKNQKQIVDESAGRKRKGRSRVSEPAASYREPETTLRQTRPELFAPYAGQWVVLEGEQIIARGRHLRRVLQRARSRGVPSPYVFYVEPDSGVANLSL